MRVCLLASGSKGNAVYIESAESRILIDAGLSAREIALRLATIGVAADDHAPGRVSGVLDKFGRRRFVDYGAAQSRRKADALAVDVGARVPPDRQCLRVIPEFDVSPALLEAL